MALLLRSFWIDVVAAGCVVRVKFLAIKYVNSNGFGVNVCYPSFLITNSNMSEEYTPKKDG